MKALAIFGAAVLVVGLIVIFMFIGYNNSEVSLRNQAAAQQKNLEVVFDKTWKVISQQAQVADEAKEAFKEIYPELMEGRYGNARGGALMSFIQEHNPQFDISLYKQVSASIESLRAEFAREQKKLLDIKREHDDLRQKFPSSLVVGSRPEIEVVIVTSSRTEEAFTSGKEDDTSVFKKKED